MPDGTIQIPPQVEALISPVLWLLAGLAVVWLVLWVLRFWRHHAYNLTKAESGGHAITPDFLKIDKKQRAQEIARGEAFDATHPKAGAVDSASEASRVIVFATAILSFCAAAAGALMSIEKIQNAYDRLSSFDRFMAIIATHKLGFALALIMIVFNLGPIITLIVRYRKKRVPA